MGFKLSPASPAGKWLGLVTAVWVQAISGNNYTFSNYSGALKTLMGLTQLQLNSLSVAKDVGKAFGVFAGLASDRLPTPVILLIGCVEGFIGYGVQWLVVSGRIQPLPYWAVSINTCNKNHTISHIFMFEFTNTVIETAFQHKPLKLLKEVVTN